MKKVIRNTLLALGFVSSYTLILEEIMEKYFFRKEKCKVLNEEMGSDAFFDASLTREWLNRSNGLSLNIRSYDGLLLNGYLIENNESDIYIIYAHGHNGNLRWAANTCLPLNEYDYNFLLFDQRACGQSEGKYSTMGKMESLDLIAWISKLIELRPNAKIVLYGTSMGASSILLSLRSKLPFNVKCVISDCGFARFKDVVIDRLKKKKLPYGMLIMSFEVLMKKRIGVSFDDLDCTTALKDNKLPILFVHGRTDEIVDFTQMKKLYNSSTNAKRKYYPIDNVGHGKARTNSNYYRNLNQFIKENI